MKASSINTIKSELEQRTHKDLLSFCLKLSRFKLENKELLSYLLFESDDVTGYIEAIKKDITFEFGQINYSNIYYIKKGVRKILRRANKQIKFTELKLAEVEILIHFCNSFIDFKIPMQKSVQLKNIYLSQVNKIKKAIMTLHPDLQYDLTRQIKIIEEK
ncbi:MAG: hypothetical protein ABI267_00880 [Ginsengibacter sp.]